MFYTTCTDCKQEITHKESDTPKRVCSACKLRAGFEAVPSVYDAIKATGASIDSHESDLYAEATPKVLAIVKQSARTYSLFRSNIDGKQWVDIPFAYEPYWQAKPR